MASGVLAASIGNSPLGETFHRVIKAFLRQEYNGVHEKRAVQEKVKKSCRDRLRLIADDHQVETRKERGNGGSAQ